MRHFSKSEWILGSNCVPDLSDHPQVMSPILRQRALLRGGEGDPLFTLIIPVTQIALTNMWLSQPQVSSLHGRHRRGNGMRCPVPVYNNAPEHRTELIDATGKTLQGPLQFLSSLFVWDGPIWLFLSGTVGGGAGGWPRGGGLVVFPWTWRSPWLWLRRAPSWCMCLRVDDWFIKVQNVKKNSVFLHS